ncbi:AMP-binding protein [Bacillus sp. 1P06AnD]|uniref:AMP-binding protein n=1 Tax=Bacillus sp. 1P06AnD TaxID=3132208 RepID=UPI0039A27BB4
MASIMDDCLKHSEKYPERLAIISEEGNLTYKEWAALLSKQASWFTAFGHSNRTVGICLSNPKLFLTVFAGAALAGWTVVPFDQRWTEYELKERVSLSNPSIIIASEHLMGHFNGIDSRLYRWAEYWREVQAASDAERMPVDGSSPFYMGFTSGSTGTPKAFIRSQSSWIESFSCDTIDFQRSGKDHVLIAGSLLHSHFLYGALSTLHLGGSIYLLSSFSAGRVYHSIECNPITALYLVPTMLESLVQEDRVIHKELVIISSGAKWQDQLKLRVREVFPNSRLYEYYGASELSYVAYMCNQEKPGSVGKAFYNVQLDIRGNDGSSLPPNRAGRIYVKSPMTFLGYKEKSSGSLRAVHDKDGWMTVGDIGSLDEEGYLTIAGRENNMILYGGINIFPEEVESVLLGHPSVEQAVVLGIKDEHWGEIAAAVIKGNASRKELKKYCRERLASYKVPREWHFINTMPLTAGGKISRPLLYEHLGRRSYNCKTR